MLWGYGMCKQNKICTLHWQMVDASNNHLSSSLLWQQVKCSSKITKLQVPIVQHNVRWSGGRGTSYRSHGPNTTRNYLICDTLSVTFSENITKNTASMTYSCFSSRMCIDGYWSPKHCDDLLNLSRFYDVFLFFCHECALMDIEAQNITTIC
jgi:hypothetical protein